jgi:hypothetical protein
MITPSGLGCILKIPEWLVGGRLHVKMPGRPIADHLPKVDLLFCDRTFKSLAEEGEIIEVEPGAIRA